MKVRLYGYGRWGRNVGRCLEGLGVLEEIVEPDVGRCRSAIFERKTVAHIGPRPDLEVDAVAIATPAPTHHAVAKTELLAGRHVFVEKPLAMSVAEGRELVDLAEERGLVLMVGHLLRYHPAVERLERLLDEGVLGRLQHLASTRLNLGTIRREESVLWSFAPHDISVILGLVGEEPSEVAAHGANVLHDQVADVTTTFLRFPSGVRAHAFLSWLHPVKEQRLVVVGSEGMAVFDDRARDKLLLYPHRIRWQGRTPVPEKAKPKVLAVGTGEPLYQELHHFVECCETGAVPKTDGHEGLRVLEVLERAHTSMAGAAVGVA